MLVVDDVATVRDSVAIMLRRAGHDVVVATDGLDALRILDATRIDLVVTDLFMPDLDGFELLRALRALEPPVPVIVMSGGGVLPASTGVQFAERLGATATLCKPFEREEFLGLVRRVLDEAAAA